MAMLRALLNWIVHKMVHGCGAPRCSLEKPCDTCADLQVL
jgi:hypothetical protein